LHAIWQNSLIVERSDAIASNPLPPHIPELAHPGAFVWSLLLEGQVTAVQLEDRQIIHRSLDRDFPFGRTPAIFRAMFVTQDGLDGFQVERRAATVDQGLKHLVHVRADLEDQVATVFDLVVGVLVTKPAPLLLVEVEGEADTGVDPTLADPAQSPYSPMLGQGVCDLRQARGVGDACKAVSFFGDDDTRLARLAGHVFVAVQHHLGWKRRVAADLDRQVAPVPVEDVERIVVHKGDRLLSLDVMIGADVPHRRAGATDQYQKQPVCDVRLGQIFFGKVVLALSCRTVDHRDAVRSGVTAHSATKPAGQPHEVGVLERLVRSGQRPPSQAEPTGIMPRSEIGVENDPVDAIIAAAQ